MTISHRTRRLRPAADDLLAVLDREEQAFRLLRCCLERRGGPGHG